MGLTLSLVPSPVPLPSLRNRGQGGGLRVRGCMGPGKGPPLPPGGPPHRPWRTASLSQEDRVTETDKSTCQEEALEKESLNSPSQEAQKGNCSQRWRRRQQPPSSPALCLWVPLLPCVPGSTCAQSPLTAHPVMRAAGLGHEAKSHCLAPSQPYDTIFSETQSLAQSEEAWVLRHPQASARGARGVGIPLGRALVRVTRG